MAHAAGIVLAGGRSSRMGSPKAALEWHGSTLLRRICGIVGRAVDGPVVVVRAPEQELPELPDGVEVVEDAREGRGPLQGIAAGLHAVRDGADAAYVSSTDVPLLHPRFVATVLQALDDETDVVLPEVGGHRHPLAAAYRTALAEQVERLIAADRMKPAFLFEALADFGRPQQVTASRGALFGAARILGRDLRALAAQFFHAGADRRKVVGSAGSSHVSSLSSAEPRRGSDPYFERICRPC